MMVYTSNDPQKVQNGEGKSIWSLLLWIPSASRSIIAFRGGNKVNVMAGCQPIRPRRVNGDVFVPEAVQLVELSTWTVALTIFLICQVRQIRSRLHTTTLTMKFHSAKRVQY